MRSAVAKICPLLVTAIMWAGPLFAQGDAVWSLGGHTKYQYLHTRIPTDSVLLLFTRAGHFRFPVIGSDVAATVVILAVVTVLSAWLPARRAAKFKPADALRTTY